MCITKDTELQPNLFIISLQRRLGAPISIVGPDTRCVGECKLYTKSALPRLLPCKIGNGRTPRTLSVREHEDAVHWESEGSKGFLHGRHQMVSKAVEAILRQLGVAEDVPSPTFTIVQSYDTPRLPVSHFDLYRVKQPREMQELGFDDALDQGAVLVEWPERAPEILPPDALHVRLGMQDGARTARLTGPARWESVLRV